MKPEIFTLQELLAMAMEQGFTPEAISRATQIPTELLEACQTGQPLTQQERQQLDYLMVFLLQLCVATPEKEQYLFSLVDSLDVFFAVPPETTAAYAGLTTGALHELIRSPELAAGNSMAVQRILHLFTCFIRDRRHSEQRPDSLEG